MLPPLHAPAGRRRWLCRPPAVPAPAGAPWRPVGGPLLGARRDARRRSAWRLSVLVRPRPARIRGRACTARLPVTSDSDQPQVNREKPELTEHAEHSETVCVPQQVTGRGEGYQSQRDRPAINRWPIRVVRRYPMPKPAIPVRTIWPVQLFRRTSCVTSTASDPRLSR